jgi:Fic-DOC domain mobile mystery protein B
LTDHPGNTPLDPDETEGLIPRHVTTQDELNQVEQANILEASAWFAGRSHPDILTDSFLRQLHKKMFCDVWRWAGVYRKSVKNIGGPPVSIPTETRKLCEDTRYWIENKTYGWDELAARFHHRLVAIHPFPNGNGRHARMATNLLLTTHGQKPFTWGNANLSETTSRTRNRYLAALKAADNQDFQLLLEFVRS